MFCRLVNEIVLESSRRGLNTAINAPVQLPRTMPHAIARIAAQPSHYIIASLAGRKYILTHCDVLTVPRLKDVNVGDTLSLSEIHEVGSRDFVVRGNPILPRQTVHAEATVVEHTKGVMETIVKKKRRKGYQRTVHHKQTYTRLRIGPIKFQST